MFHALGFLAFITFGSFFFLQSDRFFFQEVLLNVLGFKLAYSLSLKCGLIFLSSFSSPSLNQVKDSESPHFHLNTLFPLNI